MFTTADFTALATSRLTIAIVVVGFVAVMIKGRSKAAQKGAAKRRMRSSSIGWTRNMVTGIVAPEHDTDSVINCALRFRVLPSTDAWLDDWVKVALPHMRFHSTPYQSKDIGPVTWMAQKVDMKKNHVVEHSVPNEEASRLLVDHIINTGLKEKKNPWWELHFISERTGTAIGADGCPGVVLMRVHHAIGDGVSLMEALGPMITDEKGNPVDMGNSFTPGSRGAGGNAGKSSMLKKLLRGAWYGFDALRNLIFCLSLGMGKHDSATIWCDGKNIFPNKKDYITVYFPSHSLDVIKRIKNAAGKGVTVNDVEFALFAGTVRRLIKKYDEGVDPNKVVMRCMTPFSFLEKADPDTKYSTLLRNVFIMVVNRAPVQKEFLRDRFNESHNTWEALKHSTLVPVAQKVQHFVSTCLPLGIVRQAAVDVSTRMSCVFSNVPGPQVPFYVARKRVESVHMIFPNIAPQIGILSLDGQLHMCSCMRQSKKVDLRKVLPPLFAEELAEACKVYNVSPTPTAVANEPQGSLSSSSGQVTASGAA